MSADGPATTRIAIVLYEGLAALDAVGPYEVLARLPGAELTFVASAPGEVVADTGRLTFGAVAELDAVPDPDVVLVPGGSGGGGALSDARLHGWLRAAHEGTRWTTSVCTGSLILGAAGLLDGVRATTHWASLERLREYGAEPVSDRFVVDGKIVTAAGVSAGIDMALELVRREAGEWLAQAIQLGIEYDPAPPLDAGSPAKAPEEIVAAVRRALGQLRE